MTVYYSDFVPVAGFSGVEGRSLVDLTSSSFADLFAAAANYSAGTLYSKGKLAYDQDSIWVYINTTPSSGNPPPALPVISNAYWELVGTATNRLFTWIAYANSVDGTTFTDFTTGASNTGGINRTWIGLASNKTSAVESSTVADYTWTRFVGSDGVPGASNAIVFMYQRGVSAPTAPSGTFTYTFSTRAVTGGTPNGWTTAIPANDGNPLWVIAATASSSGPTDTILASEFSAPVIFVTNGATGTNGINTASIFIYQRAASAPALPTSTLTYTFATGVLTGGIGSWTQSIPAGSNPLYVSTATAISTAATDSIAPSEWAAVRIMSQDGSPGSTGAPATTAYLTNESTQLQAYASGAIVAYTGATGEFKVYSGTTDVSSNFTLYTVANPQALTIGYSGMVYTVTGGFDSSEDTATITIRASGSGIFGGVTFDKVFSLSKSKGGYAIIQVGQSRPANDSATGPLIFDENDDKLYRWTGTVWTSAVPAADIAGQLIENQLANGIVSESKLKIGVGSNMLIGAIPGLNPNRYIGVGSNPANVSFESGGEGGVFLSPAYGSNFPSGYTSWTTPDGGTFAVRQPNNTPNSDTPGTTNLTDFHFKYPNNTSGTETTLWPIEANKFYEFSVYTGAHRCTVLLYIDWLDATGTSLGTTSISVANANAGQGGTVLQTYDRLVARGQAPAAARNARLVVRKSHTTAGQADSWMFLTHPMWAETTANATQAMPYNPPPAAILNAEMLVSNSILTRHLKADTIEAQHLKAKIIKAEHLLVTLGNLNPDPQFRDLNAWLQDDQLNSGGDGLLGTAPTGWFVEEIANAQSVGIPAYVGSRWIQLWSGKPGQNNNARYALYGQRDRNNRFAVTPGQILEIKAGVMNNSNQTIYVAVEFDDANNGGVSGVYDFIWTAGENSLKSKQFTVPNNCAWGRLVVFNFGQQHGAATYSGRAYVGNISVRDTVGATMVVDGSIVAGKIAASAVTADTIEAGAVTAAKVGTNEIIAFSGNIKDLTVNTLKIANNAVTIGVSAYSDAEVGLPFGSAWQNLQQVVITTSGGPVIVMAQASMYGQGGPATSQTQLLRDGVQVRIGSIKSGNDAISSDAILLISDTPGAGTHTYTFQGRYIGGTFAARAENRFLFTLETKR